MSYLDKYPGCVGCPVEVYCGTVVSCFRLCNSYDNKEEQKDIEQDMLNEMECMDAEDLNLRRRDTNIGEVRMESQ